MTQQGRGCVAAHILLHTLLIVIGSEGNYLLWAISLKSLASRTYDTLLQKDSFTGMGTFPNFIIPPELWVQEEVEEGLLQKLMVSKGQHWPKIFESILLRLRVELMEDDSDSDGLVSIVAVKLVLRP